MSTIKWQVNPSKEEVFVKTRSTTHRIRVDLTINGINATDPNQPLTPHPSQAGRVEYSAPYTKAWTERLQTNCKSFPDFQKLRAEVLKVASAVSNATALVQDLDSRRREVEDGQIEDMAAGLMAADEALEQARRKEAVLRTSLETLESRLKDARETCAAEMFAMGQAINGELRQDLVRQRHDILASLLDREGDVFTRLVELDAAVRVSSMNTIGDDLTRESLRVEPVRPVSVNGITESPPVKLPGRGIHDTVEA